MVLEQRRPPRSLFSFVPQFPEGRPILVGRREICVSVLCAFLLQRLLRGDGPTRKLQHDLGKKLSLHGKTHSLTVFIPAAVDIHSRRVISIKSLSNLLSNFHINLQFSYQFAILISVCNSHILMYSYYVEVCNFHMTLQFSYQFAILISVCNSHGTTPALT
jgi:hypothetical protein